ncbi:MAD2L1-binding protein-like isoform X3 [Carcharodon carcharias]|uniref:MAD2L1-binding protein-like isoform X3 n=1 Tax=Carcharodon carcharias TaxID=13397 RepID=UPI001B7F02A4|nr:MAD2L1-binding protein-like isoform X3 [Carcharodon carcharias]
MGKGSCMAAGTAGSHDENLSTEEDRESGYRREAELQPRSGVGWELLSDSRFEAGGEAEFPVLFPGHLSPESCCRLVCELLKHVLYQRQQLPLPYQQLAFFSRRECGKILRGP